MSYYCGHITKEYQHAWDALTKAHPASGWHQAFVWADFKQADGCDTYKIGVFEEKTKKLIGGAVVLQYHFKNGTNFLYIPEGPILNYDSETDLFWQWRALETALHSIIDLKPGSLTTHLRIEPRLAQVPGWFLTGYTKAPMNLQPRSTQVLDLKPSNEALLAQMKPKGRYNIRLAEKKGVTVREVALSEIKTFHKLYRETFERNKFDGKKLYFFNTLVENATSILRLFIAEYDKRPIAGALIVYWGDRATYLYGGSRAKYREVMAPSALHWHIISDAKMKGFSEYDWWGIARDEHDTDHEWHGLTRFKKQFGGEQRDWIGAYDYVMQQDLYEAFVKKHET